jgi:hypothetical protein
MKRASTIKPCHLSKIQGKTCRAPGLVHWQPIYGLSLVKTCSLEMSLNITNAAKISNTTNAAW